MKDTSWMIELSGEPYDKYEVFFSKTPGGGQPPLRVTEKGDCKLAGSLDYYGKYLAVKHYNRELQWARKDEHFTAITEEELAALDKKQRKRVTRLTLVRQTKVLHKVVKTDVLQESEPFLWTRRTKADIHAGCFAVALQVLILSFIIPIIMLFSGQILFTIAAIIWIAGSALCLMTGRKM